MLRLCFFFLKKKKAKIWTYVGKLMSTCTTMYWKCLKIQTEPWELRTWVWVTMKCRQNEIEREKGEAVREKEASHSWAQWFVATHINNMGCARHSCSVLLNMQKEKKHWGEKEERREGECERKAGTQVYSYIEEKLQEINRVTGLGPVAAKESVSTAGSALLKEGMSTVLEINKDIRQQLRCWKQTRLSQSMQEVQVKTSIHNSSSKEPQECSFVALLFSNVATW